MPTQAEVPGIVAEVDQRLDDVAKQGIHLEVASEKLEDDWLYVVVTLTGADPSDLPLKDVGGISLMLITAPIGTQPEECPFPTLFGTCPTHRTRKSAA